METWSKQLLLGPANDAAANDKTENAVANNDATYIIPPDQNEPCYKAADKSFIPRYLGHPRKYSNLCKAKGIDVF